MKLLMPLVIALAGLGAGVAAGVALKPAPEPEAEVACAAPAEAAAEGEGAAEGCAAPDPLEPVAGKAAEKHDGKTSVVAVEKPFVVPVFRDDKVVAMVVASVAVEVAEENATKVEAATPRLRDSLLAAMFLHANTGGFDGAFTSGRKMDDLRAALRAAARQVFGPTPVNDVLITEIARQDV